MHVVGELANSTQTAIAVFKSDARTLRQKTETKLFATKSSWTRLVRVEVGGVKKYVFYDGISSVPITSIETD